MKVIYTDGSLMKPNVGAWAYVILDKDEKKILKKDARLNPDTTISRMELEAILNALETFEEPEDITIYSDSQYCVNSLGHWIHGWSKKGWVKSDGLTPVAHADIMKKFLDLKKKHKIKIYHIKAHAGHKWNEYVDTMATALTKRHVYGNKKNTPKQELKVIIAGSRTIADPKILKRAIKKASSQGWVIKEVVSGCADGVDTLGEEYAKEQGLPVRKFPADWKTHGKKAGAIRNAEMAKCGDALLCLWDGVSPGSANMIQTARKHKLPTIVWRTDYKPKKLKKKRGS